MAARFWQFGMRRHEEAFVQLPVLASLPGEADRADALDLVARASAASLPKGDKVAQRYLENPSRSFAVKEARAGTIDGVEALLVWTDSDVGPAMGREGNAGSSSGNTYAFARLAAPLPWTVVTPRPRIVPVTPEYSIGHPEFDARYLAAGDDLSRTLTAATIDALLRPPAEDKLVTWAVFFDDRVAARGYGSPDSDGGQAGPLVDLVVAIGRAAAR